MRVYQLLFVAHHLCAHKWLTSPSKMLAASLYMIMCMYTCEMTNLHDRVLYYTF